jgi:hypothetical protein
MKVNSSSRSVMRFRNLSRVLVNSSRLFAKPLFHLLQASVYSSKDSDLLGHKAFIHGLQNDRGLFGKKLLYLRK